MTLYMDACCFNRIFDDRSDPKIYLDRNSIMIILELIEQNKLILYGSQILAYELNETPNVIRREKLNLIYSLCSNEILITKQIAERAVSIQNATHIRSKDSLHLACGESTNVDVFLTVDKKFKNNALRLPAKIRIMEPTEWLMEVLYGN